VTHHIITILKNSHTGTYFKPNPNPTGQLLAWITSVRGSHSGKFCTVRLAAPEFFGLEKHWL